MAWQLYLMRRLRRSASVSNFYFFEHNYIHFNFYAQAAYIRDIMEFLTRLRSLVDAQAAQIRVGVLFFIFSAKIDPLSFMRRLRTYATSWDS